MYPQQSSPYPLPQFFALAVQLHEIYKSYVEAGFTEDQAMRLLIAHVTHPPTPDTGNGAG